MCRPQLVKLKSAGFSAVPDLALNLASREPLGRAFFACPSCPRHTKKRPVALLTTRCGCLRGLVEARFARRLARGLLHVGDELVALLLLLDAGEDHLRALDEPARARRAAPRRAAVGTCRTRRRLASSAPRATWTWCRRPRSRRCPSPPTDARASTRVPRRSSAARGARPRNAAGAARRAPEKPKPSTEPATRPKTPFLRMVDGLIETLRSRGRRRVAGSAPACGRRRSRWYGIVSTSS